MIQKLRRKSTLLLILFVYASLALLLSFLVVKPRFYGLSTILGTTILGTTVLGTTSMATLLGTTTVLGTTLLGTTTTTEAWVPIYAEALAMGQLAISLVAISVLVYLELSDPSYGNTRRLIRELRKSWLPLAAVLVILFGLIVFFRVWEILA